MNWESLSVTERSQAWRSMTEAQKDEHRSLSGLTPELIGLEGWRIEATYPDGTKSRFYVSRSTGWRPCHIEVKTRRSFGGVGVYWPKGTTFRKLWRK
jgi:hypothetical protein